MQHQAIAQAQAAQMALQNQLNLLQQQLSMNNPAAFQGQRPQSGHANLPTQHLSNGQAMPAPPGFFAAGPNMQNFQAMLAQQQQMRAQAGMHGVHNHVQPNHSAQGHHGNQMNHSGLSISAAGHSPSTTTVHDGIGPNGARMRVVVNETVNYTVSRQGTPNPHGPSGNQMPTANTAATPPQTTGQILPSFGQLAYPSQGVPLPFVNRQRDPARPHDIAVTGNQYSSTGLTTSSPNTTAWLLSTPVGPQALVFAPGHGYFSTSSSPSSTTAQLTPRNSTRHRTRHRHSQAPANGPAAANRANPQPGPVIARPAVQGQANENEDDLFHLIVQRGWLFLRLYVFMFVLSEPGTWRRWILLAVAVIVCLLPRENPLRDLTNRVRAHIEGLVPIAAAPGQEQQGQQAGGAQGANVVAARPAMAATVQQPGPGNAAATIMQQEQNQRNNNNGFVRETILRFERAVALFLASLVPGVGERHVRAREEARQETGRLENERIAAENARIAEEAAREGVKEEGKEVESAEEQGKQEPGELGSHSPRNDGSTPDVPLGGLAATPGPEPSANAAGNSSSVGLRE